MRIKHTRVLLIFIVLINILVFYYTWKYLATTNLINSLANNISPPFNVTINNSRDKKDVKVKQIDKAQIANKHIKSIVTVIFREFYHFDNDLKASIQSILSAIPSIKIFLIYDDVPYPPLEIFNTSGIKDKVRFFTIDQKLGKTTVELHPLEYVKTPYVLLMPDSVRLSSRSTFQKILKEMNYFEQLMKSNSSEKNHVKPKQLYIVPFTSNNKHNTLCNSIEIDLPNWTIEYIAQNITKSKCDIFVQKHAILIETPLIKEIPNALISPFPELFYIRARTENFKLHIFNTTLSDGRALFTAYHTKQEKKELRKQQFKDAYKMLQIKKIIERSFQTNQAAIKSLKRKQQSNNKGNNRKKNDEPEIQFNVTSTLLTTITYFGCEKNTRSCVGQVFNNRPFYTYIGRHTPPCCMDKLKTVFHHVVDEIENVGIRYWLDNNALRDAVAINRLSADAHEIDISFNYFDLQRSEALKKAQIKPFLDSKGFYWIKATDGNVINFFIQNY